MEQATLGEIKEYLREKGIKLDIPAHEDWTPGTINGNQAYGDPVAEKCFAYYVEHSAEIEEWRAARANEKVANEPNLGPKM